QQQSVDEFPLGCGHIEGSPSCNFLAPAQGHGYTGCTATFHAANPDRDTRSRVCGSLRTPFPFSSTLNADVPALSAIHFRVPVFVYHHRPALGNEIRAICAFKYGAAIHAITRLQFLPSVNLRLSLRVSLGDLPFLFNGMG